MRTANKGIWPVNLQSDWVTIV